MILGTGVDIIEVSRVVGAVARFGERFLNRVLLPPEIDYCQMHRNPGPHIAARFAAKEAIAKAFGTGIGAHLGWKDLEIVRRASGEPHVVLHGKARDLLIGRGGRTVLVSLSHTENYAAAMAVLDGA